MSGFVVVGLVIVVAFVAGHLYFVAERKNVDAADRFYSAGVDAFVDERRRTDYPEDCKKGWQRVAFEDGWDNSLMTLEWLRRRDQDIEKRDKAWAVYSQNCPAKNAEGSCDAVKQDNLSMFKGCCAGGCPLVNG